MNMSTSEQPGNKVISRRLGALLLVIGVAFAVDMLLNLGVVYRLWPVLVMMVGVGLIGIFGRTGRREGVFLSAGIYLLGFSLLALYCNFANWSTLRHLWPLFIVFAGLAFLGMFRFRGGRRGHLLSGLVLLSISGVFLVVLHLGGRYWWTVFVFLGLSVLASEKA